MAPKSSERLRALLAVLLTRVFISRPRILRRSISYQLLSALLTSAILLQMVPRVTVGRPISKPRTKEQAAKIADSITTSLLDAGAKGIANTPEPLSGNDVSTFPAIVGLDGVTIGASSAYVDSFDSLFGYADSHGSHANVFSNGQIDLQGAKVYGNVVSSQGKVILQSGGLVSGDLTYATTLTNSGTVQGTLTHQTSSAFTAPIPAACGTYQPAPTVSNSWVTGDFTYDQAHGDLTVSGGQGATLANGTYCLHKVTLSGGSTLTVSGAVVINLTGQLSASGGTFVNTTSRPTNLQIASSYTGNNGVTLSGGTNAYLKVLAPGTSITLSGGSPLYGALVGKTLTVSGNSVVHYDTRMPDTTPPRVSITAPVDGSTTQSASVPVNGTAYDNAANDTGLANITVNGTAATYNQATGTWSLASLDLVGGPNTISVVATDNAGNQTVTTVTVTRQNQAPMVSAGETQTITLPATVNLNGSASDDGLPANTLTTTWSKVSGPGDVTFGDPNAPVTTAAFSSPGPYVLRLTANDSELSNSSDITINVSPQNQAPSVSAGANQTIALPNVANLNGSVSDDGLPTGSTVTTLWTKVSGPGNVVFANPNHPSTTASFSAAGTYALRLTASDSQLASSADVTITVDPENQPPVVNAGADQTITLPASASLNGSVTDDGWPRGSSVSVLWAKVSGAGDVTFSNPNSPTTAASFTQPGPYVLRLTANDSQATTSDEIAVSVIPENHAPTANAGADQQIALPSVANLSGSISDDGLPSGGTLTSIWSKVSGPGTVTFANPNAIATTASFSVAGDYVLRLTANDSELTGSDELSITVDPENQAPVVNAGADQTITLPNVANLNGTVSDDGLPSGSTLTSTWSKVSGPGTVTFANPNVTVTTATFSTAGEYILRLTANDSALTSTDDVTIVVASSQAPVADFGLASNRGPVPLTTVSFSSYRTDGFETYHPKQLLDTDVSSFWWSAPGQVSNQSMVFSTSDGQAVLIDRVRLQNPFSDGTDVNQFEVQVSSATANPADFHSVLIGTMPDNPTPIEFVFPGGPATVRFIKLTVINNYGDSTSTRLGTFQPVSFGGFDSIVSFLANPNSALNQSPALIEHGGVIYDFSYSGGTSTPDRMLGYARGGWVTSTITNEFAIIQLGGDKPSIIDGVKLATGFDLGRGAAVKDFEVWVSSTTTDASAFTKVLSASALFNPQVQTFTFPGGPVPARYVKYVPLNNNNGGGTQIFTRIFDVIAEGTARVIAASGQNTQESNPAEEAFDNNTDTFWLSQSGATTDVWVKTSLQDEIIHKVRGVRITPDPSARGPKDFDIRVSTTTTDDSAFTTVYSGTAANGASFNTQEFIFPSPVDAKYVEFYWKNGYNASNIGVSELAVLADSARGATLLGYSSTFDVGQYPAEDALDIDTLHPWETGNGQVSNQWLKLSLPGTDLYSINHVALMPGSVGCGSSSCNDFGASPKDFELQISTTDANDSSFTTAFAGTLKSINLLQHFSFAPVQARYVRLLLKNNYGSNQIALNGFFVYTSDHAGPDPRFIDQSTDSDGHVVAWSWNFGDGGTSNEQTPTHHYAAAGTYLVTLTVTDETGATGTHQQSLTIGSSATAPSFTVSPVIPTEAGAFVRFTDTSEMLMQGVGHRVVDFGNGFTPLDFVQATFYPYQFADSGNLNITMTLGDNNSLKAIITQPTTVRNQPPSVTVESGKTVTWGESWTNTPQFSDPSSIDSQSLHGVWDFGDGQTQTCNNCNTTTATGTHAYASSGTYNATLTITDKDGGAASATATYTVNRRPTALIMPPLPAQASGTAFALHATLIDTFANVPVAGKPVQFKFNGATFTAVTGANGVAEVSVPTPAGTRIDIITAAFAQDSLYFASGGVGVPDTAGNVPPNNTPTSGGTNFWLMFPQNVVENGLSALQKLYITSPVDTSGTVTIPGTNFSQNFTVQANTVTTVELGFVQVITSDVVENKGIHVTSAQPITVYGMNQRAATSDAYLALPVDGLGKDHYALTYRNLDSQNAAQVGVVATENGTTVTITPSVTSGTRLAGVPYSVTLNQGQTYQLQNRVPTTGDLTGTRVSSDKPIAVFSGHESATIPIEAGCCSDHMVEQLPPTNAWGKRFATIPLATRSKGDFFRIAAAEDSTEVYLDGSLTATLNHGEWVERIIKNPAEIIATKPIEVAQLSTSRFYDPGPNNEADPFMMIIPPYSQFLNHYTITTPASGFPINYANVVAPTDWLGEFTMDGEPIPDWLFTPIGVSGFSGAQLPINNGVHNFDGPVSFGVFIYGFFKDEGYGYPGGMNLSPVSNDINVALSPETLARPINGQACFVATITNQEHLPLGGRTVNFSATGANTANGSTITDAAGQAQFCYTGTNQGTDLLRASVDTFSGTASVQWSTDVPNLAPVVDAGNDQTINLPAPAVLDGLAVDDGLPSYTLNSTWSKVSGPGTVTFASPSSLSTTATFSSAGVYVLRLSVTDLSLTSTDDVQITVNPTPANHAPTANAGPDQSAAIKDNLVVNGGNDLPLIGSNIPGWVEEQGTTWTKGNASIAGLPDPHIGNSFFYVGADGSQFAELRQDIDLSAFAAGISAGTQQFEFNAFVSSAGETPFADEPRVIFECRNANNDVVLGTLQSVANFTSSGWTQLHGQQALPAGTRWIRVRLIAIRNAGATNDAYFDSISLRPVGAAVVKLGGSVSDDGLPYGSTVSANWTAVSGPGQVVFSNPNGASSAAVFTTTGTYVVRLTSSDGELSASDDVTVNINPANQAPIVGGSTDQTIMLPATATVTGTVSDDGFPTGSSVFIRWQKNSGPGIVSFSNPNSASTTASFSTPGAYVLSFTADDSEYASTTNFNVTVTAATANQPPVVNAGPDITVSSLPISVTVHGSAADDGRPNVSMGIQWTLVSGPASVTFSNPVNSVTDVIVFTPGTYVLRLTAFDGQYSTSDDVTITATAPNQRPTVNAGPDAQTILSQPVQLNGSATDDGLPLGNTLTTVWTKFSGPGTVTFGNNHAPVTGAQFSAVGTYVLRLIANDGELISTDDVTIVVNNNVPAPTVQITAPVDDASVTEPTAVTGSVSGGDWKLEYSMDSTDDESTRVWTTFASGSGVAGGTLGNIDPTMMLNGLFDIRLSSTDQYGQTSRTKVSVIIERNLKIGNFTVSFTDLSIPVAGVPMEVTRTYDSRDKRVGDFGFGWTMAINNIRVEKSSVVGLKWYETVSQEVLPNYCLQAVGSHTVTVTFPGGKVFKFQPQVAPQCQRNAPITTGTISFTPMPGTVGKLEVVGNADVQIDGSVPGPVNLIGLSGVDIFNSFTFKFTAQDGTAYIIDQRTGLQSLADTSGNTLTVSANGIVHSSGKSIVFHRDIAGRIESIDDPNGNSMFYEYDEHGDLVSFTDNEHNKSTYTYDANHRLLTIKDPRGLQPIRNDYDPVTGRLISHTDAFNKQITYLHDIPHRTETVTDRLNNPTVFTYDERGNVLNKRDARGGVTTYTYDANDNILTAEDALHHQPTIYTYDENNNRTSIKDSLGNLTQFVYNEFGKVLTVEDPLHRFTINVYDSAGRLKSTEDPLHNKTKYNYSVFDGQLTSIEDPAHQLIGYEYTGGYLTKVTEPLGKETTFINDNNGNRRSQTVKRTNALGQPETITTSYDYDKLNRLTKTTFADHTFTTIEYNSIGKQAATVDQLHHRTEFAYDEMGRLIKTTYPDNTFEENTYDAEGRRETSKDRAGHVTSYDYDELGRLTKTTFFDGTFTQTTYDAIGQVETTIDARDNITRYFYDDAGRRNKITNALSQETLFTYDENGNQRTMTDALHHITTYDYDADNRRIKTTYHDNSFDSVIYDEMGRAKSKTDQANKTTQFTYDELGRLQKVTDALTQDTTYGYNELGQPISQTDANLHTTRFEYDQLGRRVKRTLPGGQFETYSYDDAGNLQSKTDFNGKTTTFAYDSMRRLLSKTPDASFGQPAVTFTYNANGQRETMTDASGTTIYGYDNRDRLNSKQTPFGTLTYSYNNGGGLQTTRSSNANGVSVDYTYDALNRLATVKDNNITSLNGGVTNYTYDDVGNLQSYQYPNGVTTSYAYNSLNRLTTMTVGTQASSLASYSYTLGAAGNRTAVTELGGRTVTYTYDNLYRLTSESIASDPHGVNGSVSYGYDAVGNRLNRTSNVNGVPTQNSTYDPNDRLTSDNYDNNGNTTGSSGNGYGYDFENHLTSLNNGAVTYVYDGDGNRVAKTVGSVTTNYLVDTNNPTGYAQVVDELQSGAVVKSYTHSHEKISQRIIGGSLSFYQYDGHGSVRQLTDATSTITDAYDYDAFGNLIYHSGTTPNDYLYSGEQFDANLGFYYLRARYMNPSSGRFWTMDSFQGNTFDPQSLHKYLYTEQNPVSAIDPSGHSIVDTLQTLAINAIVTAMTSLRFLAAVRLVSAAVTVGGLILGDQETKNTIIVAAGNPYEAAELVSNDVVLIFRNVEGAFTAVPAAETLLRGSGPVAGVIEVSPRVQSTKVLEAYYPKNPIEFVFDPRSNTFAVGKPAPFTGITGSPHVQLAQCISADESSVVGGTFSRGPNGAVFTNENSGHYGLSWNNDVRKQFVTYLQDATGLTVNHEQGW